MRSKAPCVAMIFTPTYTRSTYPQRFLVTVNFQLALASAIAKERKKLPSSFLLATPCLFAHPFVMQHLLESAEKHETCGNMSSACEINAKFVPQEMGWSETRRNIKRWLCVRYTITLKDSLYRETFHIWSCMLSNLQMFACALSSTRRSRGKRFRLLRQTRANVWRGQMSPGEDAFYIEMARRNKGCDWRMKN